MRTTSGPDSGPIRLHRLIGLAMRLYDGTRSDEARRAVEELARIGGPAVVPVLDAMNGPFPEGMHGRDAVEALGAVLVEMARIDPEPLVDIVLRDAANPDPQMAFVLWALKPPRRGRAVDAFLAASKHRNATVRMAAIEGLVESRDPRAIDPVIRALRDRSHSIRFAAVEAVDSSVTDFFRVPRAAEDLRRLLGYKSLEKKQPGTFRHAVEALRKIEGS